MTEREDTQKLLAKIAAEAGGELRVESGARTVAPMPTRRADGSFVNQTCPRCGGDQFAHSYGDELCRCAGCGAVLDVDELKDPDPIRRFLRRTVDFLGRYFHSRHHGVDTFVAATKVPLAGKVARRRLSGLRARGRSPKRESIRVA